MNYVPLISIIIFFLYLPTCCMELIPIYYATNKAKMSNAQQIITVCDHCRGNTFHIGGEEYDIHNITQVCIYKKYKRVILLQKKTNKEFTQAGYYVCFLNQDKTLTKIAYLDLVNGPITAHIDNIFFSDDAQNIIVKKENTTYTISLNSTLYWLFKEYCNFKFFYN